MDRSRPLFGFIFVFSTLHNLKNWWKHNWCAWESNSGRQDGRCWRIHWAMAIRIFLPFNSLVTNYKEKSFIEVAPDSMIVLRTLYTFYVGSWLFLIYRYVATFLKWCIICSIVPRENTKWATTVIHKKLANHAIFIGLLKNLRCIYANFSVNLQNLYRTGPRYYLIKNVLVLWHAI